MPTSHQVRYLGYAEMQMTNDEIDRVVFDFIQDRKRFSPHGKISNLGLGCFLLGRNQGCLPQAGKKRWVTQSKLHNAQEIANRSCQRLRKRGLVEYGGKTGWLLSQP